MELLVIWIICGAVTAIIAASKGRSGAGWLMIGLLLGIFGVILVACMPAVPNGATAPSSSYAASQAVSQQTKACPDCAETILLNAKVCKHCGYRFDTAKVIGA